MGTIFGLILIPGLYVIFAGKKKPKDTIAEGNLKANPDILTALQTGRSIAAVCVSTIRDTSIMSIKLPLTLTPYIGYNSFNAGLLFNPASFTYRLIGGLTAPIFNRKDIKAEYERTIAEEKIAAYNYQKTILSGLQEG